MPLITKRLCDKRFSVWINSIGLQYIPAISLFSHSCSDSSYKLIYLTNDLLEKGEIGWNLYRQSGKFSLSTFY